jgi:ribosomal protein L11 methyltransferase
MTSVAKFLLSETDANALAAALDGDDRLSALPVGLGEAEGGRWQLSLYLSEENDEAEAATLKELAAAVLGRAAAFSVERLPETDWVAESLEGLPPVRAGRFLVHGSHDRNRRRPNDVAIEIEAAQAFGTGHHGTTAGCLMAIDRLVRTRPVLNALDIGTGSGVLAIAIARTARAPIIASDIDPVAVRIARENVRLNGVARYVRTVAAGDLARHDFSERAPFDLIVGNILAGPLVALAPAIATRLASGGTVILSGLLPAQRARIVAAYRGKGLALIRSSILDGWLTLTFTRPNRKGRSTKQCQEKWGPVFRPTLRRTKSPRA